MLMDLNLLEKLNVPDRNERLRHLAEAAASAQFPETVPVYVNNHIHTFYSFSPYSPAAAVYAARLEGLATAGIVDHDTMAGAAEFLEAAQIIGMPATVGMECRVSFADTAFAGHRLNSPDQTGIAYMTIQSVPHDRIDALTAYFAPFRKMRENRNRLMVRRLGSLVPALRLSYENDVLPLSMQHEGGTVTERHLLDACGRKLRALSGDGPALIRHLEVLGVTLSEKQCAQLSDPANPYAGYDLLGVLKSSFLEKIYVPADKECPPLADIVKLCADTGAFLCYAYLGDVTESVTGDKKAQKFEDTELEDLFACLYEEGVRAVTYMPTRNTQAQVTRLRALCEQYGMFQVSGEDINSPRQKFAVEAMRNPAFANLVDAAWTLIRHEEGT